MKKMSVLVLGIVCMCACIFTGCNDDDGIIWRVKGYRSLLTVKIDGDGYYFENDKGKTLAPITNLGNYSPKQTHRAFVSYTLGPNEKGDTDYAMYVHRIDSILTKQIAPNRYEENDLIYGTAPVRIERIWVGGGFLNIKFGTYWGGKEAHFVNLIQEYDENPFFLTFRHNAYDDPRVQWGYGWVAFNLSDLLEQKPEAITIEVETYNGRIGYSFPYSSILEEVVAATDEDEEEEVSLLFY